MFIGDEGHLAPPQSCAMQTSGTKAKPPKQIATHCWQYHWNDSENVRTPEHVPQGAAKLASAREFAATVARTFQRLSQPLVRLRKKFLDELKAVVKAKKIDPASFSTEHHGAWSS